MTSMLDSTSERQTDEVMNKWTNGQRAQAEMKKWTTSNSKRAQV